MSAPTLRERIAAEMWRHKMVRPGEHVDTWCTCLSWSTDRGPLDRDERAWTGHLTDAVLAVVADWLTEECRLDPAEGMALTVARAQVMRGDEPTPNVAAACIIALDRLTALADRVREGEA